MTLFKIILAATFTTTLVTTPVLATTLDFTWTGIQESTNSTGAAQGSLSFADGLTSVSMADLTEFEFSGSKHIVSSTVGGFYIDFSMTLGDVTSLAIEMPSPQTVNIALTASNGGGGFVIYPDVGALNDVFNAGFGPLDGDIDVTIEPDPVSEPVWLAGIGLGVIGLVFRKRC